MLAKALISHKFAVRNPVLKAHSIDSKIPNVS